MKIRLHVGAHRTGTTTLQSTLKKNAARLEHDNVRVLTCWGFGDREDLGLRSVTRLIQSASNRKGPRGFLKVREAKRELQRQIGRRSISILVLSDENLLGQPFSLSDGTAVYPNCRKVLLACARVLPEPPDQVHITIRDYSAFLASAYAMTAVYGKNVPQFSIIKDELLCLRRRWPDVLYDIQTALPKSRVSFSLHEGQPVESGLRALLEPEILTSELARVIERKNVSPTREAIEAALEKGVKSQHDADALVISHSSGTKFDPFTDEEKAVLSERYANDILLLRKTYRETV